MSQEPVEVTPPTVLDQEQPLLDDETGSLAHTRELAIVLPEPSEGFPQHQKSLRQRARHWIPRPSIMVFIALAIFTALSFCPALLSDVYPADRMDYSQASAPPDATADGMYMVGSIFGFDWSGTQKLSVVWSPIRNPWNSPLAEVPLNDTHTWGASYIYFDNTSDPVYYYAPTLMTSDPDGGGDGYLWPPLFVTELSVIVSDRYFFPEDQCEFGAMIFIIDEATNGSVPISDLELDSSGPGDFYNKSYLLDFSIKFVYDAGGGPTAEWVRGYYMGVTIKHSLRARAITYSMFTINWVLTLCSIIATSVMFNRRGEGKDTVALLPITVVLTIPVIRSLYVGSPPYGIYLDVVGFFPQMLTVVACTIVVLSGFAIQSRRGGSISHGNEDV